MPHIRYICLSDLHFGQDDSLMTCLNAPLSSAIMHRESPALVALCNGLRELLKKNREENGTPEMKTTLILGGDILEIALTTMNRAAMVFRHFIEHLMPENEENLFDRILYVPGNHDHHMWELARETQYVNYIRSENDPKEALNKPWHDTRMFEHQDKLPLPEGYFVKNLLQCYDHLRDFEVSVAYPNLGLYNESHQRCAIFHHGHFTEPLYLLMTELASMFFPERPWPDTVGRIELENFAWIDFFWSTMGRSGEVGEMVENIYISLGVEKARDKLLENLAKSLAEKLSGHLNPMLPRKYIALAVKKALEKFFQKSADQIVARERTRTDSLLSPDCRKGLQSYLNIPLRSQMKYELGLTPGNVTFVFGHTHKPYQGKFSFEGYPGLVRVYNTGGWVVEKRIPSPIHGAAAVLLDENLNATSLRLYNQVENAGDYEVRVEEATDQTIPANPLTEHVSHLLRKTSGTWGEFSRIAAEEVEKHREYLEYRVRKMEKI